MVECGSRHGKYMVCCIMYRSDVVLKEFLTPWWRSNDLAQSTEKNG